MAYDSLQRYQAWYGKILWLYPERYYERYAESMEQSFSDLLVECRREGRGLVGCALWMYFETLGGIINEHYTSMDILKYSVVRALVGAGTLLMIPLIAMLFTNEVNWDSTDFIVMGTMILTVGVLLDQAWKRLGTYRAGIMALILFLFFWLWAELAVGVFTNWGS